MRAQEEGFYVSSDQIADLRERMARLETNLEHMVSAQATTNAKLDAALASGGGKLGVPILGGVAAGGGISGALITKILIAMGITSS
jgi:hypothetical protein